MMTPAMVIMASFVSAIESGLVDLKRKTTAGFPSENGRPNDIDAKNKRRLKVAGS
jgi:hypothetical protein